MRLAAVLASLLAATAAAAQVPVLLPRADGGATPVLTYPARGGGGCPRTVIVSHGLGGSEEGLGGLARGLSARGWRVMVMGHRESGRGALREGLGRGGLAGAGDLARDPALHAARALDLDAALAAATATCRPRPLILAGHSMGAQTTMMEAGAVPRAGRAGSGRFDAYVALSPQGVGATFAP